MRSLPDPARPLRAARALPAVLLVAGLAISGCGTDDDEASPEPTVSATQAPPGTIEEEPAPETTPDDAQVVSITVQGGQVTGVEPRTVVPVGTQVRLTITSDAADEVHVHGYDLTAQVTPDQAVQLEFLADRPGIFEVELHDSRVVLTRLQVQ